MKLKVKLGIQAGAMQCVVSFIGGQGATPSLKRLKSKARKIESAAVGETTPPPVTPPTRKPKVPAKEEKGTRGRSAARSTAVKARAKKPYLRRCRSKTTPQMQRTKSEVAAAEESKKVSESFEQVGNFRDHQMAGFRKRHRVKRPDAKSRKKASKKPTGSQKQDEKTDGNAKQDCNMDKKSDSQEQSAEDKKMQEAETKKDETKRDEAAAPPEETGHEKQKAVQEQEKEDQTKETEKKVDERESAHPPQKTAKRKQMTTEQLAAHARYMRFSRSFNSRLACFVLCGPDAQV